MSSSQALPRADQLRLLANRFDSLVHGAPTAAGETLITMNDGRPGFNDRERLDRAEQVCSETSAYLLVMLARTAQLFPDAGAGTVEAIAPIVDSFREHIEARGRS